MSSLLTNYDITFWLLLQSAVDSRPLQAAERKPCTAVPFRSVMVKPFDDKVSQTMAALNLVLVNSKIEDDELDGERWKARTGKFLFGKSALKARTFLEEQDFKLDQVFQLTEKQHQAEQAEVATLESLSAPTGEALGQVFLTIATLQEKLELSEPLTGFGNSLGRFLYLWDALHDLEDDRKTGAFNAISRVFDEGSHETELRRLLLAWLHDLNDCLKSMALGPEAKLCFGLVESLASQVRRKLPKSAPKAAQANLRPRLAKAGMVRAQMDCCDCGSCCDCGDCCSGEVGCCECGNCCDCNLCDCNPCDSGDDACCEFSCCNCCGDSGDRSDPCCCCCGNSGGGRSSSGCCDSGETYPSEVCCLDLICCSNDDDHYYGGHSEYRASANVGRKPSLMERFQLAKSTRNMKPAESGTSQRDCPACRLRMIQLTIGDTVLDECRNCGGIWCDDKEIDELARLVRVPHNLVNRYPVDEAPTKFLPGERDCPKCDEEKLVAVPYLGVPIEMCRECHGFWIGHGLLKRVLNAKRSPKRLLKNHKADWRCPYCDNVSPGGDICHGCGAPRPKSGFTGKLN